MKSSLFVEFLALLNIKPFSPVIFPVPYREADGPMTGGEAGSGRKMG